MTHEKVLSTICDKMNVLSKTTNHTKYIEAFSKWGNLAEKQIVHILASSHGEISEKIVKDIIEALLIYEMKRLEIIESPYK